MHFWIEFTFSLHLPLSKVFTKIKTLTRLSFLKYVTLQKSNKLGENISEKFNSLL